jgi:hypothetical protein
VVIICPSRTPFGPRPPGRSSCAYTLKCVHCVCDQVSRHHSLASEATVPTR